MQGNEGTSPFAQPKPLGRLIRGPGYYLWYDYAGVLGRPISTEVTVSLAIEDAVIWVVNRDSNPGAADWGTLPLVFGHFEHQLALDPTLESARANVQFTVTILNDVGAPMPDLIDSLFSDWGKPGTLSAPANPNASNGAASLFPNDEFHLPLEK